MSIRARLVSTTFLVALAVVMASPPALAHDGAGILKVESSTVHEGAVHYVVRLTWENDGHPAADATITAVAFGGGGQGIPVVMTPVDDNGRYEAQIGAPGSTEWQTRFTSVTPTATIEAPGSAVAPPATTTTETPETTPETSAPGSTTATSTPDERAATAPVSTPVSTPVSEDDGSDSPLPVILILSAIILAVGAVFVVLRRRSEPADQP